ncbi:MAG: GNAT family N-acetyltransferase [Methanotrichaceae archaeon]|nr:GNAT family N-acetyltransferase [Methanotrichaceae archaeon]
MMEFGIIKRDRGSISEMGEFYEMRFLDISFLEEIISLQNTICQNLSNWEIYRPSSADFIRSLSEQEHSIIGVLTYKDLVAYSMIYLPGSGMENLGRDIGLLENELEKVAHLQTIAVHPSYRGNSLQTKLAQHHLNIIKDMGYEHVCCTVSPMNPISLKNIMSLGFIIRALKVKFGGYMRCIMHKNFHQPFNINAEEFILIGNDIAGQVNLLNKGYLGFKMELIPNGFKISYGLASNK